MVRKAEVLAPAGSLDHGLWALEGGADAVYVGMKAFSARSHAQNFSLEELAGLTSAAQARGARVYVAMNTILNGDEVAQAVSLAWELYWRGVSALIVQDLGLGLALKQAGPPLALHGSTQAAVHNPSGVRALKDLGYQRVVLARELTLEEIQQIIQADPTMEYEVFIHGALCYAVSGNCMASGLMLGRSANQGDCGQVCRTKFQLDYLIPGPQRRESPHEEGLPDSQKIHAPPGELTWKTGAAGAFASMNDLELGSRVRDLEAVGVTSLKIEGRMKPPAYSFHTARAYKTFLAGGRDEAAWEDLDEARLRFGRLPSTGWLDGHKALAQTNPAWASSLGLPLGALAEGQGTTVKLRSPGAPGVFKTLDRGDGVLVLGPQSGQNHRTALTGPAQRRGDFWELPLSEAPDFIPAGGTLWLLSRHDGKLPQKKPPRPFRYPIPVRIQLTQIPGDRVRLEVSTLEMGGLSRVLEGPLELSQKSQGPEAVLRDIFMASDSRFFPGTLEIQTQAGAVFISPKELKELRRSFFRDLEVQSQEFAQQRGAQAGKLPAEFPNRRVTGPENQLPRSALSPLRGVNHHTGFVVEWSGLRAEDLASTPWGLALPLAPFTPKEKPYFEALQRFCRAHRDSGDSRPLFLGLNNPGHLTWVRKLRSEGLVPGAWFADWAFHTANPWTPEALDQILPGLALVVPWLEAPENSDKSYFPPLFTSRACMLRNSFSDQAQDLLRPASQHSGFDSRSWTQARQAGSPVSRPAQGPRCPQGCGGHFSAHLIQGKKKFRLEARDCINYLILEE